MTILDRVGVILWVCLLGFSFPAGAQTNVYTMPPTEVRAARATAFILNGTLSNIYIDDGGTGYTSPPNVAIVLTSGSGSGAVVAATVANGSVTGLTIQNPGSYSSPAKCKVIIDLPPNPLQNAIKSNLYSTIVLPPGSFDLTTVISNNVTIRGQGMNLTTISGAGLGSVFRVTPGKTVTFENLTITRGSSTNGGGIYNDGGLVTVVGCRISENEATGMAGEGGGIYNRGSAFLIVTNSVISNNTSRRNGGGIANSGLNTAVLPQLGGTVQNLPDTLRGFYSDLQNNVRYGINYTTDYFGNLVASPPDFSKIIRSALSSLSSSDFNNFGKIDDKLQEYLGKSQRDSTLPLDNSVGSVVQADGPGTITNAMSDPYGSGMGGGSTGWVDLGAPVLFILSSTISGNTVTTPFSGFGGGIHNDLGLVFVDNSTIENNLADSNLGTFGGGINSVFGAIRIQNSRLNNNTARSKTIFAAGGAVLSFAGFLDVHDSEFHNNQVEAKFLSSGGAIKHTAGAQGSIEGSSIVGNRSGGGGGIANDYLAKLTIDRTTIEGNSVSGIIGANGGGIRNDFGGELEISNSTFSFNVATDRSKGGGLYNHAEEKFEFLEQSLIGESKVSLVNCTFSSNRVDGTYLKIPNPGSLASCLLAQQYPPYRQCDFSSLPTTDIPLTSRGGAIYNGAEGGGEAELTMSGCTVYGNSTTGPLPVAGGLYLTGSAGLNPTNIGVAILKIGNSIVARGTGVNFSKDILPTPASVQSQGGNLDSDGTLASSAIGGGVTIAVNPGLGALRNNGGPTRTHALLTGSPAINTGDSGDCTATDQRGVTRSLGGVCDIGAVEKVNPFGFADSYVALQEQPLIVNATSGVLSNDFPDAATAQLVSNVSNGTLSLSPDGSFTYTGNTNFFGTNTFTYRLVDGAFQSGPILVTIVVRPVLKIVSTSPVTNRVDAPLNSDVAMTFNHSLNASTVAGSIKVRGSQSRVPNAVPVNGGATATVNPSIDFRPGEVVSVSALKSLRAANGAELLKPAQWQFTADVLRGDGLFKPGALFSSYGSEGAAVGDFDGDGDLDIFVARKSFGDQVWRNDGNGVFTMAQSFRANSSGAAVGDVDGDGDLDLVVSKRGGFYDVVPTVTVEYHTVLRNNGVGFFTETGQKIIPATFRDALSPNIPEPFRYTALVGANAVKLADLNGDGSLDILFLGGLSDAFYLYRTPGNYVWLNNGSGYFEPTGQVFGDTITYDAALGDLDGDGDIDVFTANSYSSGNSVPSQVWLNNGGGHFSLGYQTDSFWGKAVALGDLDGDGDLDAVVGGAAPDPVLGLVNRTRVLTNNGLASFAATQFVGDSLTESVAIADLNADGHLDLVLHHGLDSRPWTNNGSGNFTWNGTKISGRRVTEVCPGDFDGDGDVDLLVANVRQLSDDSTPNEGVQNQVWYNNNLPVATNDSFVVAEDGLLTAPSVLANDFDADGDSLAAETTTTIVHRGTLGQLIAQFGPANNYGYEGAWPSGSYVYVQTVPLFATNGTLNFQANGTFTYRPNSNFFGTDGFQYVVTDGHLRRTGTVSITVTPLNDAPLARDDYYTILGPSLVVNAPGGVLVNDSDIEGTALTASVVTLPAHGSLTLNPDGSFSYTRSGGWTGTDSFTYRASDGVTNSTARVKIGNTSPIAVTDNYALPGSSLTINAANGVLINDTDPDGDTNFAAILAAPPSFGTLQLNANGSFTYNRATNHSGNDSFTYFASDGFDLSQPARVKLGNAAPVAVANSYNAFSGTALVVPVPQGVLANDSDPEGGDTLAVVLVSGPTNGVLTLSSNGSFTYTANANFSGIDAFTYQATDGLLNSSPVAATFTVNGRLQVVAVTPTINAVNVATNSTVEISFNVPLSLPTVTSNRILIYGSLSGYHSWSPSASSNKLILSLTTPFRVGESVRVALLPGIRGTGLFELETAYAWNFTVGSPRGGLNFTEITPSPTNHTSVRVALGDVNGDGRLDALTVGGFDAPAVLYQNNGGSFTERLVGGEDYRQVALGDLDRDGDTDAFMIGIYRERWLNDGAGNFAITQMASVNPLITCMTLADLDRDGDLDVFLAAVDYSVPIGQGIVWSLLNDGSGSFTDSSQTFIVNSVGNAAVADLDGDGDLDAYLVGQNGDVVLFNDGSGVFTAGTQNIDTSFNQDVDLNDLDGDGDMDAFVVTGDGNRAGRIYYNDGTGRFLPSGLSPQPRRLSSSLALGDINGDGLIDGVESVALGFPGPLPGTNSVWLNTGTQYTNRTFAVTAGDSQQVALGDLDNDGDLDAFFANGQGTPTLNRIWINQSAPQALDDFYAANGGSPVVVSVPGVLANDKVGDGGSITAILDAVPAKGSVTLNANGSFTYTPGGSFTGSDVFTYHATDGSQNSRIARVKIGNSSPSATNDGVYVAIAGTPLNVAAASGVLANDSDPEADTLTALLNAGPIYGSLQLKANGSFVYTATNGYVGADSFTYRASDGVSNSSLATVTFDVRSQLVLLERTPSPNELRARTDANVVLRFNSPLNPSSVVNNIVISGSISGPIGFSTTLSSNVLTLNPSTDFFVGEQITVLLTDDLEGLSSQRLAKPLVWQFNVEAPFGRGNISDGASPLVNTNCATARVMFADFNRDTYLDVLCVNNKVGQVTNRFGGSNTVWFGTAQGALVDSGQRFLGPNVANGYVSTTMGDIDGDGDIDLVSRLFGGTFDFWTNNGAGFFGLNNSISNAAWDGMPELGDLDADKDLDLFIVGNADVTVLTNNGTGQFNSTGQVLQPGTSLQFAALGDLDGDGDLDAIVQPFFAGGRVLLNDGAGFFSDTGQALGLGGQRVCLADFDGDADLDFIQSRNPSLLFVNDGQGNFTQSSQVFDSFTTQEIKPADLDGDGDLDLVLQASEFLNGTNANRSKIWYNDGAGNFTSTGFAFGTGQMANFGVADVNRDGALDVLINRPTFVEPLPVERWFNSIAMGLVEGGTTLTINDTDTVPPFTNIVLRSPPSLNVSLQVRLDNIAKGTLTPASLATAGFTGPVGNTYSRTASSASTAQVALRQLVFAPTPNRRPVGQFELTAFSIEATDGTTSRTNSATVVTSLSVNTPPVANNDGGAGFGTIESATFTTANVLTNDLDVDPQDVLSIQSVNTTGLPGTLNNLGNGTFQYIPGGNFVSLPLGVTTNKSFQYTVSDASGALASATVTLTITGQNSAPVAANDTITVGEKAGSVIFTSEMLLNDYDVDAGEHQSLIVSALNTNGTSGIVTLLAGDAVSYNRNGAFGNLAPGVTANTTFGYTLRDVHNATSAATVTLTIVGTNDAPVAQDDVITLTEIAAPTNVTARLLSNDSDPDPGHTATLTVSGIDTVNTLGSVIFTNQTVTYSPNGQFNYLTNGQSATDSFTYFVTDTNGATASAIMTVTILGTNTPPTALPDEIVLQEDAGTTNVTALLLANDTDGDTNQTATLVLNGVALTNTTGSVTFINGVITYTPSPSLNLIAGQTTNDTFLYIVRDQQGLTATNSATVTIIGVNDAPVATNDVFQISEDGPAMNITSLLLANDTDPNPGDAASLVIDGVFTNGTIGLVTLTNGLIYYNPSGRFHLPPGVTNSDLFLYSVRDRFGSNSLAAVSVTVFGVLSQPGIIISSIVVQTNGHVRLRHNGGDDGYTVLFSQNLMQWQVLGPSTWIGPGGLFEYVDATAPAFGQRFYRILVGQPPVVISSIMVQTNGNVRLRHNGGNGGHTVQVSTNLIQWQVLGPSTLLSPGLFEYVDTTALGFGRRYYRVRSP